MEKKTNLCMQTRLLAQCMASPQFVGDLYPFRHGTQGSRHLCRSLGLRPCGLHSKCLFPVYMPEWDAVLMYVLYMHKSSTKNDPEVNSGPYTGSQREVYIMDTLYNYCVILICVPCVSEETFFVQFNVCTKGGLVEPLGPPCVQA